MSVQKSASGQAKKDANGDFVQAYTVKISVNNGQVELQQASDIVAPSNPVITGTKNVTVDLAGTKTTYPRSAGVRIMG